MLQNFAKIDYQQRKEKYDEKKIFDTLKININISLSTFCENMVYTVRDIVVEEGEQHQSRFLNISQSELTEAIRKLETDQNYSTQRLKWSSFYSFKEILDIISGCVRDEEYKIYYRGQSGNWPLKPTIFREGEGGYSDKFRINYESIFNLIMKKFPNNFQFTQSGDEKRAENLAVLQHYGLGTPLVDITENPFIAMLFMSTGYKYDEQYPEPRLDVFFVKEGSKDNKLFQDVEVNDHNKRVTAQKGAFLNFDKLEDTMVIDDNVKIDRVSICLSYVSDDYGNILLEDDQKDSSNDGKQTLALALDDIRNKLYSYHYNEDDLFPDFDRYLSLTKRRYADKTKQFKNGS
ncbi:MAG: FRG domain-containing protein [Lactobacillaceae bacterium]|jgi:hypothetical protein|nr:FRG domain-containing protein [Lactobacillaceae bacterium]